MSDTFDLRQFYDKQRSSVVNTAPPMSAVGSAASGEVALAAAANEQAGGIASRSEPPSNVDMTTARPHTIQSGQAALNKSGRERVAVLKNFLTVDEAMSGHDNHLVFGPANADLGFRHSDERESREPPSETAHMEGGVVSSAVPSTDSTSDRTAYQCAVIIMQEAWRTCTVDAKRHEREQETGVSKQARPRSTFGHIVAAACIQACGCVHTIKADEVSADGTFPGALVRGHGPAAHRFLSGVSKLTNCRRLTKPQTKSSSKTTSTLSVALLSPAPELCSPSNQIESAPGLAGSRGEGAQQQGHQSLQSSASSAVLALPAIPSTGPSTVMCRTLRLSHRGWAPPEPCENLKSPRTVLKHCTKQLLIYMH